MSSYKITCSKCNELARLLIECRDALDALSAITVSSAKLHNVSLSLADRIEYALTPRFVMLEAAEGEEGI
jgi:hypothetical protein